MRITLHDGTSLDCQDRPFNQGTDGAVHWSNDGRFVVKLYHQTDEWRQKTLEAVLGRFNAVRGDPYWEEVLCWPRAIVQRPSLGVVLPRAPQGLKSIAGMLKKTWLRAHPEDLGHWHGRTALAIRLARAVRRLHMKGLCHSDISENNVFGNSSDGRAYLLDCDGLVVPGIARPVVRGTPKVMAPELVSNPHIEPSVETDLHALAVLIYQLLLLRHPLEGPRINDPDDVARDDELSFGTRALYIEHPSDNSNQPRELPYSAGVVGEGLNSLMEQAFVTGLHAPKHRPLAGDWERELVRSLDRLVRCANQDCPLKTYPLPPLKQWRQQIRCPWCQTPLSQQSLPLLIWLAPVPGGDGIYRAEGSPKVVWPDTFLYTWHLQSHTLPDSQSDRSPLAAFQHKDDRDGVRRWYLLNAELPYLEVAFARQSWRRVRRGETVELSNGLKLRFAPPGQARDALVRLVELA